MSGLLNLQAPDTVVMVRPHYFSSNPQTQNDNGFQHHRPDAASKDEIAITAEAEVTEAAERLQQAGVDVLLFEDTTRQTPDSVFPNNWFSTHHDGSLIVYPMYASNRRLEYRSDILDTLSHRYAISSVTDLRKHASQSHYLEGTGSIVFDHLNKLAFAARSKRTSDKLLRKVCQQLGYCPILFDAFDIHGAPVYHTNVLMSIGTEYVMICMDMVAPVDRPRLTALFNETGKQLIVLSEQQIYRFCGNTIELTGHKRLLALSSTAADALTRQQLECLASSVDLLPLSVPTIELAGGSVRCMLAGVHLPLSHARVA